MKIAIFGKSNFNRNNTFTNEVITFLLKKKVELIIYKPFFEEYTKIINSIECKTFSKKEDLITDQSIDYLLSLGGDGTFLDAANFIGNANIPILGINTGRIGFLTGINKNNFEECWELLENKEYEIEERTLLHLSTNRSDLRHPTNYALNDITIHSTVESAIIAIHVWVNNVKINTYWADGLIIATPTGSTAYSLSCGGPIIVPNANVLILTPIASHSLSVRPIIISDDSILKIKVDSRNEKFSLSCDSHQITLENPIEMTIKKGTFTIKTVRFKSADFFSVIREKLLWGIDIRNI